MKKLIALLILSAGVAFAQPTTPYANMRISGTDNVVLDSASMKFGTTTPGAISGANGALTFAAAGTNQNINVTASGSGIVVMSPSGGGGLGIGALGASNAGAQEMLSVGRSSNGDISSNVRNSMSGTAAQSTVVLNTNAGSARFEAFSSAFTSSGTAVADGARLSSGTDASGGLAVGTRASAALTLFTNDTAALTVSTGQNVNINSGELQTAGNRVNYNVAAQGAGTAYSLTNTAAAIDFGTTDPAIVLDKAGTYLILGQVQLTYTGATVVAETATIKVRRTNNTAADLSSVVVLDLPVATTLTHTYGIFQIPPIVYTTAVADDAVTLFANVSAALGAGTIDATAAGTKIQVVRLY